MENGEKYQRVSDYDCLKCPDQVLNAIRVIGVGLLVFLFLMGLIILNIRKRKDSPVSVLSRIFTNYLQLIATSLTFELQFPEALIDVLGPINALGSSNQSFLSFDCFISDYEVTGPFPSNSVLKLFMLSLLPIALFILVALIWIVIKITIYKWVPELKRNLAISFISIVFFLHPTMAYNSLSIFQCVDVDDDVAKVRIYTEME